MQHDFIPFARPFIDEQTISRVAAVLRTGILTGGPCVEQFESALSEFCGGRIVRTFNSGTAALAMALRLLDIGPGDKVITTPLTWVATANVIVQSGADPVFIDVDYSTRTINFDALEAAITSDVRAVIPVDIAGLPVNRDRLYEIANYFNLHVIEDAAHSFGSMWKGQSIGSSGEFIAFSFHANKNLTTAEGGALVLPNYIDVKLCERLRLQGVHRLHDGTYDVDAHGLKVNMNDIAAAIGLGQLEQFQNNMTVRRQLAKCYFLELQRDCLFELPEMNFENSNWHMFQVLLPSRIDRRIFVASMKEQGIGVGLHYPSLHLFSAFRQRGYRLGDFPIAEDISRRIISLPLHLCMNETDVLRICDAAKTSFFLAS